MTNPAAACGPVCGQADALGRWDDRSRRVRRTPEQWPELGFERLDPLTQTELISAHFEAAKFGRTTGTGLVKDHFLASIWSEYRQNLVDRIDPVYTVSRFVKHSVMHRPWRDANRRTSFLWAATTLRAFGYLVRVDTEEAKQFKETVKQLRFGEVYDWFEKAVREAERAD